MIFAIVVIFIAIIVCIAIIRAMLIARDPSYQDAKSAPKKPADTYYGDRPANTENPDWRLVEYSLSGIVVTWQEKYGGEKTETCLGLWESSDKSRYMLTWKDSRKVFVEKANINDLQYRKIGG